MERRIFLLLSLLLAGYINCQGQCPSDKFQWDLSASYGFISTSQFSALDNQERTRTVTSATAALFITARYFLFNRLAIGLTLGISGENGQYNDPFSPQLVTSTYQYSSKTVAVEVYYVYYFRKRLELYTFLGAGPTTSSTQTTEYNPTVKTQNPTLSGSEQLKAQYTPFGIRVGGRLGAYAEMGYGYKGIFNFGLGYKLGPSCWWRKAY